MTRTDPRSLRHCGLIRTTMLALAMFLALLLGPGMATPGAANGLKTVKCALPYTAGGPNFFCTGMHQILYTTQGFTNNNSTITAELVAFDSLGNLLGSIPVHSGDLARLTSNTTDGTLAMSSKKNLHTMVAPVPMLRVTADDGVDKVTAYCSPVPQSRVFEPDGAVVSASESGVTHVLAAIPLVDPANLLLTVDGVDILAGLGIGNAASCTPASPCGGNFPVGSNVVTVSNLVVDVGPINTLHRNTVSFDIAGLGCGGHLFAVNGQPLPGARPKNVMASCHKDAIADKGLSSVFAVTITAPTSQQTNVAVPVNVQGEVCSGLPIAGLNINGIEVPVAGQTTTPGNGTTTADTHKFTINVNVPETNLSQDFATGDAAPGADAGSNLLIAAATDSEGNRTFTRLFYATHTTLNPGVTAGALGKLGPVALEALTKKFNQVIANAAALPSSVDVDNAFLVALSPQAIQQQFDKRCPTADAQFKSKAKAALEAVSIPNKNIEPPCSCGANTSFSIGTVTFTGNTTCNVAFSQDKFTVTIGLPTVNVPVTGSGHCGECIIGIGSETTVSGTVTLVISNTQVTFDVTEAQLLNPTSPQPTGFVQGTTTTSGSISVDACEFPAGFCGFVLDVIAFISDGSWPDFTPDIDLSDVTEFKQAIAASEPDPVKLNEIKIDEQKVANFDQTVGGQLSSVQISANGILAGLKGSFATDVIDPEILGTPGALILEPTLPSLPIPNASDAVIALSTDTINMFLASMTVAGRLKESCQPSGKTLGDLLPADCDSLINEASVTATALQQGICHGIRGSNCETLGGPRKPIKQGACHGTRGDNCATIPTTGTLKKQLLEKATCQNTPNLNLHADQNILFCTRQDIPPRMAVLSGGGSDPVSTALRLKSLSVALLLDRQGDGLDASLDTTPQCFGTGAPRIGDCALYEACLDMNFKFEQQFVAPADALCGGLPGFKSAFKEVQILSRQAGVVCSGAGLAGDDALVLDQTSSSDIVTITLPQKAQSFAPPVCMEGLTLGNFVTCGTPQLLAIGAGTFKDYLGVTCGITAAP